MANPQQGLNIAARKELEVLGLPEMEELTQWDGKPIDKGVPDQPIQAMGWDNCIDEDDEDIRTFDLGKAFLKGTEPGKL